MANPLKALLQSIQGGEILLPILRAHLQVKQHKLDSKKLDRKKEVVRDAERTVKTFLERIAAYQEEIDEEGMFHPSGLGKCPRQQFFKHFKAPDNGPSNSHDMLRTFLNFEIGTYFHVIFQNLCEDAGILESREVAIIDKVNKTVGHADGILTIDGVRRLLEIKTINSTGFAKLTGPQEDHQTQMLDYMKCLGLTEAIIVYYEKDRNGLKEYLYRFSDAEYAKRVKAQKNLLSLAFRSRNIPDRVSENPNVFPCRFCAFSKVCFVSSDLAAFKKKLLNLKNAPQEKVITATVKTRLVAPVNSAPGLHRLLKIPGRHHEDNHAGGKPVARPIHRFDGVRNGKVIRSNRSVIAPFKRIIR